MARAVCLLPLLIQVAPGVVLKARDAGPDGSQEHLAPSLNAAQCAHAAGMGLGSTGSWTSCKDVALSATESDHDAAICWDGERAPRMNKTIYVLHLPKTAACSLVKDISKFIDRRQIWSNEGCWSTRKQHPEITKAISMVRDPRSHVLSQYQHCRKSSDYPILRAKKAMPETFEAWIGHWTKKYEAGGINGTFPYDEDEFGCSRPINVQAQRFNCDNVFDYPDAMGHPDSINTERAIRRMMRTEFVGLMEAYQESICLFHAQHFGRLPSYCDCTKSSQWMSFQQEQVRHGVEYNHDESQYSEQLWGQVHQLNRADTYLYRATAARFRAEIDVAEKKFGVKILCDKSVGTRYGL